MRPLRLTMTAFGPYKDTEIIDFKELGEQRLFVISGNTGAGKTTIFDGISFALYGSASGTDRENQTMLRSDFADDDVHTAVELVFELNGREYRVLRQLGHVKKGNKTKTGDRYELFEQVDGAEVPSVDRQIVSEIDKKVEEIIGLSQDQFKQIVMLPQGEFRKLLTSETENKEEILRRLFKTEPYKHISERLKRKRDAVEKIFNQEKQAEDHYIKAISATLPVREDSMLFQVLAEEHYNMNQISAGLTSEITFYEQQMMTDKQIYTKAYEVHDQKYVAYHQAKTLNDRFDELSKRKQGLKQLEIEEPSFIQKSKQLKDAERASQIEPYEKQAANWQKDEQAKRLLLEQTEHAQKVAKENFSKAHQVYEQEKAQENVREETNRKLDRLKDHLPTVQAIDESKQQLHKQKQATNHTFKQLEELRQKIKTKQATVETDEKKIKQMDQLVSQRPEKQQTLIKMREKVSVCISYLKLNERQAELTKEVKTQTNMFNELNDQYKKLEESWLNGQASILANHLHDGEACPVCGSHEHPEKTTHKDSVVTRGELEAVRKKLNDQEAIYRTALANQQVNKDQLNEKAQEVESYQIPLSDVAITRDQLTETGTQLKGEVAQLEATNKQLITLKEKHEQSSAEMKQLDTQKEKLEKTYQEQYSLYERNQAVFEERLRVIPEDVRSLSKLKEMIYETDQLKIKLAKDWDMAQKNLQSAKEIQTKTMADVTNISKQLEESTLKRNEADQQFKNAQEQADFATEKLYQQAKLSAHKREELKTAIDLFGQNLATAKHEVKTLQENLQDKQKMDLTALELELKELKESYETALNKWNQSKEFHKEASTLKTNMLEANERVKKYEQELRTVTDLYDTIRGQNNPRISFERYLQIEYLEQIIDASNLRLRQLSNGQFQLMRSSRQEARGRQSGLAFDVYDAYTGQTRDVKTLSGGEKFNTSLCLALGMSDVIQSFQGNISINTMFIDEGFGSLDEESLNKSIDTLIDLQQSGRMIGVISHVQELKSIFPAVLEVTKTKEGYSKTKFVVK